MKTNLAQLCKTESATTSSVTAGNLTQIGVKIKARSREEARCEFSDASKMAQIGKITHSHVGGLKPKGREHVQVTVRWYSLTSRFYTIVGRGVTSFNNRKMSFLKWDWRFGLYWQVEEWSLLNKNK